MNVFELQFPVIPIQHPVGFDQSNKLCIFIFTIFLRLTAALKIKVDSKTLDGCQAWINNIIKVW